MTSYSHLLQDITRKIDTFPSLPSVASKVLELTSDPECTIDDIESIISCDQSLSITLMRLSNSVFYGRTRKVSSLKESLSVIGISETRNIIVAKAIFNSFKNIGPDQANILKHFWQHSFITGLAAKILSKKAGFNPDEFFIAGLIHDVGKLIIYMAIPDRVSDIVSLSEALNLEGKPTENDLFGITHEETANQLLNRWLLPEIITKAIMFHHRPDNEEAPPSASVLYLSNILSHLYVAEKIDTIETEQLNTLRDAILSPQNKTIGTNLNLPWDPEHLDGYIEELDQLMAKSSETFSLLTK